MISRRWRRNLGWIGNPMLEEPDIRDVRCIVWGFDGVLNRNIAGGRYVWLDGLAAEFGIDAGQFETAIFKTNWTRIITGREDILDRLDRWAVNAHFTGDVEDVLEYWFTADLRISEPMERLVDQVEAAGLGQVIATNSDPRRARFLEQQQGWGEKVDAVFASGRLGVAKPDPAFFAAIEEETGLDPRELLFVEDRESHLAAAEKRGWQGVHFTEGSERALVTTLVPLLTA